MRWEHQYDQMGNHRIIAHHPSIDTDIMSEWASYTSPALISLHETLTYVAFTTYWEGYFTPNHIYEVIDRSSTFQPVTTEVSL